MSIWVSIGELIKRDRFERDLSQRKYGHALGVTQQTIARWEEGNKISEEYWSALSDQYDIDIPHIESSYTTVSHNKSSRVVSISGNSNKVGSGSGFQLQTVRQPLF